MCTRARGQSGAAAADLTQRPPVLAHETRAEVGPPRGWRGTRIRRQRKGGSSRSNANRTWAIREAWAEGQAQTVRRAPAGGAVRGEGGGAPRIRMRTGTHARTHAGKTPHPPPPGPHPRADAFPPQKANTYVLPPRSASTGARRGLSPRCARNGLFSARFPRWPRSPQYCVPIGRAAHTQSQTPGKALKQTIVPTENAGLLPEFCCFCPWTCSPGRGGGVVRGCPGKSIAQSGAVRTRRRDAPYGTSPPPFRRPGAL